MQPLSDVVVGDEDAISNSANNGYYIDPADLVNPKFTEKIFWPTYTIIEF